MFILIFEQLVKMFFIMVLAFICYRIGLVDQNGNKNVSNLLLMVVNPILIITVYQTSYDPELVRGLLFAFAAAAVTHVLGILISGVLIRSGGGADTCIERFSAMYSNCGFIGIPLIGSVLGDTGIFYISAYMVIFNLFSWTHGVMLMEGKFSLKALADVHRNMPGGGPVLRPSGDPGRPAGFHELCGGHEHAPGHDGGRILRGPGGHRENVPEPAALLHVRAQAAGLPALHGAPAPPVPAALRCGNDHADRGSLPDRNHLHDDGDPV